MRKRKPAGRVNIALRQGLQSLEDAVLVPSFHWIKQGIKYFADSARDECDERADARDKYIAMLHKFYPEMPKWHEEFDEKDEVPAFDPKNPGNGCAGEVLFLEKYEKSDSEFFKQLMKIRINYFQELENKKD